MFVDFSKIKVGDKIYYIVDTYGYEVVKIGKTPGGSPSYYVAHMDGDCSKIHCIYTEEHQKQWLTSNKSAWIEKAKWKLYEAEKLKLWVDEHEFHEDKEKKKNDDKVL